LAKINFEKLKVSKNILKALNEIDYLEPSEVQRLVIPKALEGKDIIAQARTGSGKTAAYVIPILEKVSYKINKIQVLILSPTRELAIQIHQEVMRIGKYKGIKAVLIYGGQKIEIQLRKLLTKPHVIVGTPGRIIDLIDRGKLELKHVRFLVIDEADKMFEIGFLDDIEKIVSNLHNTEQRFLISATIPPEVISLAKKILVNPAIFKISQDEFDISHVEQEAIFVDKKNKFHRLVRILRRNKSRKILIFTNTKKFGLTLTKKLAKLDFYVKHLSSDLTQRRREQTLNWFRKGKRKILVASDLASRGLDIVDIDIVINYDFPRYEKLYIHRVGRTARFDRSGKAISIIAQDDKKFFERVYKRFKRIHIKRN